VAVPTGSPRPRAVDPARHHRGPHLDSDALVLRGPIPGSDHAVRAGLDYLFLTRTRGSQIEQNYVADDGHPGGVSRLASGDGRGPVLARTRADQPERSRRAASATPGGQTVRSGGGGERT